MNTLAILIWAGLMAGVEHAPLSPASVTSINALPYAISRPGTYRLPATAARATGRDEIIIGCDRVTVDLGEGGVRVVGGSAANIRISMKHYE